MFVEESRTVVGKFSAVSTKLHSNSVGSNFYWELFIVRTMLFGKICRFLGEKMSSFLQNCSCTSVRTAFYVNKRKAFLSILIRKLCFPKCLYFFIICRIRSNIFPVFLHWIFWQGCQSCIQVYRGPFHGENQSETTFFSKTFFRILNKKYSDFSQNFFGRFQKNCSTCPENSLWKSMRQKKSQ